MSSSTRVVFLFALMAVYLCLSIAHPSIGHHHRDVEETVCDGCGDECHKCVYGYTISKLCGIFVCRRGPGGICGGPSNSWGVCGDGLLCNNCNRCAGCSLDTYTCNLNPCLPTKNTESHRTGAFTIEK